MVNRLIEKIKIINLVAWFTALVVLLCSFQNPKNVTQDFEVYRLNNEYIARGRIDLQEHCSGSNASEVIQQALNRVGEFGGGSVYIHSGVYKVNKQINVPGHSTLFGSGNGTKLVFADNHDTGIAISCTGVDNAIVKNLFIKADLVNISANIGVLVDSCGTTSVDNVTCLGMQEHGIVLSNNSFLCSITGCKVGGTGKSGILIKDLKEGGRGGDYVPSLVSNCIVYASEKGIECDRSLVVNITDCQVYQTKSHGFYIHSKSNSVIISGCRTFQITGNAVKVDESHEINISSNIFCWHTEEGIVLDNVIWGSVTGNNIIDNGSINLFDPDEDVYDLQMRHYKRPTGIHDNINYSGVYLKNGSKGITITGNSIFNWPVAPPMKFGIEEDETCFSNIISANNINFCKNGGVSSKGKETVVEANRSYLEEPYIGKPSEKYQYFDTRQIDEFIKEIN